MQERVTHLPPGPTKKSAKKAMFFFERRFSSEASDFETHRIVIPFSYIDLVCFWRLP